MSGAHRAALLALNAAELRARYADSTISPIEVTDTVLAAARQAQARYAAVTCINGEDARREAASSAARWRAGTPLGPLDGVPITFKDSFNIRGLPRWHGSAVSEGVVSTFDAAPVRRAREAGMVIVAKTSMPDYGLLMSGLSSHSGIVRNPWNPLTNPAGSSAGAAACLACGVAPLALGTDMVGSVRLPAAACGLASIHATQGRVAYDPPGNYRGAGPMARTVGDVAALLEVVGQYDPADHYAHPGQFRDDRKTIGRIDGISIGFLAGLRYGDAVDELTLRAATQAAQVLAARGADVTALQDLDVTQEDYDAVTWTMLHKGLPELYAAPAARRGLVQADIGRMCDEALNHTALFMGKMAKRLGAAASRLEKQLAPFDYILSPALPVRQFPVDAISPSPPLGAMSHMGFACWFNQLGRPAGTVAVMQADQGECPISVQIAGRRFDDSGVLHILRLLEQSRDFLIEFPIIDPASGVEI